MVVCLRLEQGANCLHMVQLMPLHPQTPSSLASFKSRLVSPFWYRLTQVVLHEKRPLNGCNIAWPLNVWPVTVCMLAGYAQVLVAAFAVSSYASTTSRCAHKPFNPLLGETFECAREDRGWKFISEQVRRLLSFSRLALCYR